MKKTYITPQAWILKASNTAILTGSGDLSNGGQGTPGAHGQAKTSDIDFDTDCADDFSIE